MRRSLAPFGSCWRWYFCLKHGSGISWNIVAAERLSLRVIKRRIANWVERLSPTFSLVIFAVPVGLLVPFKIAGLWLLPRGYWTSAAGTLIFAKKIGLDPSVVCV